MSRWLDSEESTCRHRGSKESHRQHTLAKKRARPVNISVCRALENAIEHVKNSLQQSTTLRLGPQQKRGERRALEPLQGEGVAVHDVVASGVLAPAMSGTLTSGFGGAVRVDEDARGGRQPAPTETAHLRGGPAVPIRRVSKSTLPA
jgi:hypothetical protein